MNNETKKELETISTSEISQAELESIASSVPVKSNVRAGAGPIRYCCCGFCRAC